MKQRSIQLLSFSSCSCSRRHASRGAVYPEVRVLSNDDALFVQQQAELDDFRKIAEAAPGSATIPPAFALRVRETSDRRSVLTECPSRASLRYPGHVERRGKRGGIQRHDTASHSQPGRAIREQSPPRRSGKHNFLHADRGRQETTKAHHISWNERQSVYYFPGEGFSGMERAYFLADPVPDCPSTRGTSPRCTDGAPIPFTGAREFHGGLDIGAP